MKTKCDYCHKQIGYRKPTELKRFKHHFCSRVCYFNFEKSKGWLGKDGYRHIRINGKQVNEHRWLIEREIGRELMSNEVVHHINNDKTDNRIINLELTTRDNHTKDKHPEVLFKMREKMPWINRKRDYHGRYI